MSEKEMRHINDDDYLKINEFAHATGIHASTLRYYDDHDIFKPEKRGKDKNDTYRYYSSRQITEAKMIKDLREIGVKVEEIGELGKDRSPELMIKLLTSQDIDLTCEIHYLQDIQSVVRMRRSMMVEGISANENEISICEMPEVKLVLGEPTLFAENESFFNEYLKFRKKPRNPKINPSYPSGGYYDSIDTFTAHPSQADRFFSLDPDGYERKERGMYLVGYTRGYYGALNDLPERMVEYAKQHKITFDGPVYNICLLDELCIPDTNQYLMQVSASIESHDYRLARHPREHIQDES